MKRKVETSTGGTSYSKTSNTLQPHRHSNRAGVSKEKATESKEDLGKVPVIELAFNDGPQALVEKQRHVNGVINQRLKKDMGVIMSLYDATEDRARRIRDTRTVAAIRRGLVHHSEKLKVPQRPRRGLSAAECRRKEEYVFEATVKKVREYIAAGE